MGMLDPGDRRPTFEYCIRICIGSEPQTASEAYKQLYLPALPLGPYQQPA